MSSPTSCFKARSALRSDQVAQGFTWLGLENLQAGNLSGQPLPQPGSPCGAIVFPYIWTESLTLQFMSVVSWTPVMHCCKEPGFISSVTSLQVLEGSSEGPQSYPFSRLNKLWTVSFSLKGKCSSPNHGWVDLGWLPEADPSCFLPLPFLNRRK